MSPVAASEDQKSVALCVRAESLVVANTNEERKEKRTRKREMSAQRSAEEASKTGSRSGSTSSSDPSMSTSRIVSYERDEWGRGGEGADLD